MKQADLKTIITDILQSPSPFPANRFAGRGIVICAGGPRYFVCAFVLLHVLRHALGCTLPVQVWHLGARELSPAMSGLLQNEGAEIIDAEPLLERYPVNIRNGWALKPFAVMHSRFAEVLSLDADALPLVNPAQVFDWTEYRNTGALFWPDIIDLALENPVWTAVNLPPRRETSFETGQLVVNKQRVWTALALTVALNSESETLYQMIYGEKDSFLLAFLLSGLSFHRIAHRPLIFDSDLIQLDAAAAPFIHHRTFSKFLFTGPNRPVFGDQLTGAVENALTILRTGWTGIVFHPPAMSEAAQAMATKLAGVHFVYQTSGTGQRDMVLDANFQVGTGRAEYEQHWAVIERDSKLILQFFSATHLSIEMLQLADGSWGGATDLALGFSVRLVAKDAAATMPFANNRRVSVPSGWLVEKLFNASGARAGLDDAARTQLQAALTLLNRTYDDVPETLLHALDTLPVLAASMRNFAAELAALRDTRLQRVTPSPAPVNVLRPGFYDRIS